MLHINNPDIKGLISAFQAAERAQTTLFQKLLDEQCPVQHIVDAYRQQVMSNSQGIVPYFDAKLQTLVIDNCNSQDNIITSLSPNIHQPKEILDGFYCTVLEYRQEHDDVLASFQIYDEVDAYLQNNYYRYDYFRQAFARHGFAPMEQLIHQYGIEELDEEGILGTMPIKFTRFVYQHHIDGKQVIINSIVPGHISLPPRQKQIIS